LSRSAYKLETEAKIRALVKPGELTDILTNASDGIRKLQQIDSQLEISRLAIHKDPETSIQLSYDAARKSVAAILEAFGLRVHERAGSHSTYLKVMTLEVFNEEVWRDLEWMRKLRNTAQYGDSTSASLTAQQAEEALIAGLSMALEARKFLRQQI
jgi:hypothetical protein